ncbi:hypothetical protein PHLCEN_2v862 [Hermanssonia centrifuga]|uniref:Protein kinase domain-containing protein n=1 Tax=Hermanssonia centrifuga TaxID=98765 RepID=A0A2R6S4W9_9APHY|nr:hypothetical protein PHLCEN_2v862 [Hermanssonia centrifuga]
MTWISGREIKDTLIDAKGTGAGELTIRFDVSFGPSAQFTLTEDLCRDYPTANRLRNVIRQSERIRDLDIVRNGIHASSGTRTITLWELWRAAQSNIRMRYAKSLKVKIDEWFKYVDSLQRNVWRYPETIVKDGVLRYNAAEDLLIQISLLVDYFLDTHQVKPVKSDVASELVYGIAQAVLLLEEVVNEPIISLMYSQLRSRDKDFMDRRTCLFNLRCKLLIHREGHSRQEVLEGVDRWKPTDLLRYAWNERRQEPNQRPFTDALLFLRGPEVQFVFECINMLMTADAKKPENGLTAERSSFFRRILTHLAQHAERLPAFLFLKNVEQNLSTRPSQWGSFGSIYESEHEGTRVAIKLPRVFAGENTGKDKALKQFYQEVIVWQSLRHEHILNILGVTYLSELGAIAMVSPLMIHGTLGGERRNIKEVSTRSVNTWIKQIAQGMAYLHDQEIVHGDLRGDNVFLDENYSVHIADFGLSVYADGHSGNYHSLRSGNERWTAVEMLFPGNFPDVSQSGRPTKEADVYSFACVCVELYTRKSPFSDLNTRSVALHVLAGRRVDRPNGPDGRPMPDALWALVQRCWAQNPKQRPRFRAICEQLDGMFP